TVIPSISKRATSTHILIRAVGTHMNLTLSQAAGSGGWKLLASALNFARGTNGYVRVSNNTGTGGKNVAADAFRWAFSTVQVLASPVIMAQPQPQKVLDGSPASFEVGAEGSDPLTFQWHLNGVPLAGQTNATLLLPSV